MSVDQVFQDGHEDPNEFTVMLFSVLKWDCDHKPRKNQTGSCADGSWLSPAVLTIVARWV